MIGIILRTMSEGVEWLVETDNKEKNETHFITVFMIGRRTHEAVAPASVVRCLEIEISMLCAWPAAHPAGAEIKPTVAYQALNSASPPPLPAGLSGSIASLGIDWPGPAAGGGRIRFQTHITLITSSWLTG